MMLSELKVLMMLRELKAPDKLVYATMPWEEHMRVKTDIVPLGDFAWNFCCAKQIMEFMRLCGGFNIYLTIMIIIL